MRRLLKSSMLGLLAALVLPAVFPAAAHAAGRTTFTPQITNSQDASPGEYPYMVSLQAEGFGHFCGGSVIDPEWILTAAHCIDGSDIQVYVNSIDLEAGDGDTIEVAEQIVHPDYVSVEQGDDIALLRLAAPTDAEPVDLVDADTLDLAEAPTNVTLTGWGGLTTDQENQTSPTILQEADMPIISTPECVAMLDGFDSGGDFDEETMICAGAPEGDADGGVDACQGDSGGPLVATEAGRRIQVGIVSWGPTCGLSPTAYTRISTYFDFITQTMSGETPEPEPTDDVLDNTTRLAGANRFATAASLATNRFDAGVPVAFVVTGTAFADALAAAPVAASLGGPVLLTTRDSLPQESIDALTALAPQEIVVVGGTGAVADGVAAQLDGLTEGPVTRVAGNNRFETAAALMQVGFEDANGPFVVLASGESFADALGGAAYAASPSPSPLLLTGRDALPDATRAELERLGTEFVMVLGGTGAIGDAVTADLEGMGIVVDRIAGATRYETSAAIAELFGGADEVLVATGTAFPDGLVAGALGLPLVLVPPGELPSATSGAIEGLGATSLLVLGGTGAVSDQQALELDELVGG